MESELPAKYQSGFLTWNFGISQLLTIIHQIHSSFYYNLTMEEKRVFLLILKLFHQTWHDELISRLKS